MIFYTYMCDMYLETKNVYAETSFEQKRTHALYNLFNMLMHFHIT